MVTASCTAIKWN